MSSTSPLRDIHLYGWDDIELTVLSALVAKVPLLFVGDYGAAKSDGAAGIARTILGDRLSWAVYECPNIQTDDLVGFPKPSSLNTDQIEFVGSAISVWKVNAVVLDEIGRAHRTTVAKFMELVRTNKVYGLSTNIELLFATTNPPTREFHTEKLDPAIVSRFAVVHVPSFASLSDDDARKVLEGNRIGGTWGWWPVQYEAATDTALQIRALLMSKGVHISGRSALHLQRMLGASRCVPVPRTPETMRTLVLSCIPEAWAIATNHRPLAEADAALVTFFERYLGQELPPVSDWPAYMSSVLARVHSCASEDDAQALISQIPVLRSAAATHGTDVQAILANLAPKVAKHLHIAGVYSVKHWLEKVIAP